MKHPTVDYPKDQWWIAAYSSEVGRTLLARTILGQRVVLYRKESGEAVAVAGYCPHRNYPLENGSLVGDAIRCGYHGFEFSGTGMCTKIPSQLLVMGKPVLPTYPLVEKCGVLWIWTGDPGRADLSKLPDAEAIGLGAAGWQVTVSPMITIAGRYSLLIENLMDLTHVSFIHADTIPAGEAVVSVSSEVVVDGQIVRVVRKGNGLPSNPFFKLLFPDYSGSINQHFDSDYLGPCLIRTGGQVLAADDGRALGTLNFIHAVTPETKHSTHYFVLAARNFGHENPAISQILLGMGDRIQPQDSAAIEAIERGLQAFPEMPREISCEVDQGGLRVRRMLAQQISQEA